MTSQVSIRRVLPHRYPIVMIDRIEEVSADGTHAVGIKCVSSNEPWLQGHFPDLPIVPGVLIVEALAQCAGAGLLGGKDMEGKLAMLAGVDGFRFRRPVVPGDVLRLEVTLTRLRGPIGKVTGRALVGTELVAEGEITFAIADRSRLGV
ncbi:MAG: 3-hydroxyacyl-ACP dehydratase FabZ [Chloroflexi bacterium]|nr:3-hydroxyacyl-ACP dehydratase FabZ [Chloroflexota bacterium]